MLLWLTVPHTTVCCSDLLYLTQQRAARTYCISHISVLLGPNNERVNYLNHPKLKQLIIEYYIRIYISPCDHIPGIVHVYKCWAGLLVYWLPGKCYCRARCPDRQQGLRSQSLIWGPLMQWVEPSHAVSGAHSCSEWSPLMHSEWSPLMQ